MTEGSNFVTRRWAALSDAWRTTLIRLIIASAAMLLLFAGDWAAMVNQWWNTATYNHALLVPLILVWLVWLRRTELVKIQPEAWWPGLIPFGGAAFIWLLGAFSGLDLARQAGVIAMCAALVPLFAGPRVLVGLLFPLFYMIFLIPMGQELVPTLQMVTADITIALVQFTGIEAAIDGVFINTPVGLFEVAEACSGVMFLIAMLAFGAMMANVCFVSNVRRAALILACIVVPILANGVRAWGTIYAAQIFGIEVAVGFDHIVYGWFFFAFVLILVIALAWRFFDREVDDPIIDGDTIMANPLLSRLARLRMGNGLAIALFFVMIFAVQGWAWAANRASAPMPHSIALPEVKGWSRVNYTPHLWWEPRAAGAEHRLLGSYADGAGRRVDVFYALYSSQKDGFEAGGFGQGALTPKTPWAWQSTAQPILESDGVRLLGYGRTGRVAQTWFRHGELVSGSNPKLKLALMKDRLTFRSQPTVLLIISAEDAHTHPADSAIRAFVESIGPIGPWMDGIRDVN